MSGGGVAGKGGSGEVIWFDAYDRQARLAPGLLALLPISVMLVAVGFNDTPVVSALGGVLTAAGGPLVLVNIVRSRGRAIEDALFRSWDGAPTTQLLSLRRPGENDVEREAWRQALAAGARVALPSAELETADPQRADRTYGAMTAWALEATRGNALVQEENKSYGFNRNMLGMRPTGIAVTAACLLGLLVIVVAENWTAARAAGLLINGIILAGWVWWPKAERVRDAGFRYARQLLRAATFSA